MKYKSALLLSLVIAVMLTGCGKKDNKTASEDDSIKNSNKTEQTNDSKPTEISATDKSVEIQCSGMTCTGCENTIKSRVKKVDGVKDVNADFNTNIVKASFDPAKTNTDAIKEAITAAGYKVVSVK